MFGNTTIALLFSLGFAGWVYAKIQRQTGGNTKSSLIVSACAALIAFLILSFLLGLIPQAEA
jgi:hypothetical protein